MSIKDYDEYEVSGISYVAFPDGKKSLIHMNKVIVKNKNDILYAINDGGCGCNNFLFAIIDIFGISKDDNKTFLSREEINLIDPESEIPIKERESMIKFLSLKNKI